ncbi:neural cell adhesion molecule 2-like [Haliotis asinina]|uniref:neural cell adhesion molecule 2-like n=1 Tax=Haliotis asinina TaxID=109174 RepID=UPI003531B8E6
MLFSAIVVACLQCIFAGSVFRRIGDDLDLDVQLPPYEFLYVVSPHHTHLCTIIKVYHTMKIYSDNQTFRCGQSTEIGKVRMSWTNITSQDAGHYHWSLGSMVNTSGTLLTMFVTGTPTVPTIRLKQIPVYGHQAILRCQSNSTTIPATHHLVMRYQWLQENQLLRNNSNILISGDSLTIKRVNHREEQQYQCLAKEDESESVLAKLEFSPEYGPYSLDVNVSEIARPVEDSNLCVSCVADCKPSCTYTWLRKDEVLYGAVSGVMVLPHVKRSRSGYYSCKAYNRHGDLEKRIQVDVQYQPNIMKETYFTPTQTINEGQEVDMRCDVDSNPAPTITWLKEDIVVKRKALDADVPNISGDQHIFRNSFTKKSAVCEDGGLYRCQASNGVGNEREETVTLHVKCSVRTDGDHDESFITPTGTSLNVTLHVIAYPKPLLIGWEHIVGDNAIKVNTQVYTVTYVAKPKEFEHGLILTHVDMTDIDQGEYRTEMTNDVGSSLEFRYIITVQVPPEAPKELRVTMVGETYVGILWKAGFNGHAIQHFEISFKSAGASEEQPWTIDPTIIREDTTHVNLSSLDKGTMYKIRIRARNDVGTSGYSNMVNVQTQRGGKPSRTDPRTTAAGQTTGRPLWDHTSDGNTLMKDNETSFVGFHPVSYGSRITGIVFALVGTSVVFLMVSFLLFKGPLKHRMMRLGGTMNQHTRMSVEENAYELPTTRDSGSGGGEDDGENAGCSSRQSEHIYEVPVVMEGTEHEVPSVYLMTASERCRKLEQPRQRTTCEF